MRATSLVAGLLLTLLTGCAGQSAAPSSAPASEPALAPSEHAPASQHAPASEPAPASQHARGDLPTVPAGYAAAAFDAWLRGDRPAVEELAQPAVADVLLAWTPEAPDGWEPLPCEGAAGSTYCAWVRPESQLTIRVANEAASRGQPHAVTEARVETAPSAVAIWPYTTEEEARNSQDQVDQGHSPWQLSPEAVAIFYAGAELGWQDATAEPVPGSEARYTVADPESAGTGAELELAQPVREGDGGIWAVTQVTTIALDS